MHAIRGSYNCFRILLFVLLGESKCPLLLFRTKSGVVILTIRSYGSVPKSGPPPSFD